MTLSSRVIWKLLGLAALSPILGGAILGCGSSQSPSADDVGPVGGMGPQGPDHVPGPPDPGTPQEVGSPVQVQLSTSQAALLSGVAEEASAAQTPQQFAEQYSVSFAAEVSYDPTTAVGMDLIQASVLALDATELELLDQNGFVVTARNPFPSFAYGYHTIYMLDLPVYVSVDSILDAVHRSNDEILQQIEQALLIEDARTLLSEMRGGLAAISDAQTRADADFYLAVALSLLTVQTSAPMGGADASAINAFVAKAKSAAGVDEVTLFGVKRSEDFSQFKPRGHYTNTPELEQYFRALMWLGRIDFRLLETQSDGSQVFRRRQFDSMLAMNQLMNAAATAGWDRMNTVVRAFVGESDYMTPPEVPNLIAALGGKIAIEALSDEQIAQAIVDGGFGQQLIASHIVFNDTGATLPLNVSFALFGQRYVIDSHVLSNVVYDRVAARRMMPNPLDVAFAALGNNQAGVLLGSELTQYAYSGNLAGMRSMADHHPADFWDRNLYNTWLSSVRALSPAKTADDAKNEGLPSVAKTEAWGRRMLNAQLASWAELRHNTILYVKQSYTSGVTCEFPDAYVDPYPEVFAALGRYTDQMQQLTELLRGGATSATASNLVTRLDEYLTSTSLVLSNLGAMAQAVRDGVPFTEAQLAFINEAVMVQPQGCGGGDAATLGWYSRLFFDNRSAAKLDPTIADVHTQPTDEGGAPVGKVLHVATALPRLMVVTTESCTGARAYAGLAFSYHEHITENFERIDDETWKSMAQGSPPDVPWVTPVVAYSTSAVAPDVIPPMMMAQ